ncbi:GNAT family protein [Alkalibacillus silvisoli]|uniref:GNAT family N-acetyltransferase n=1 Tax=Alkalibacillus silvisoli TaxID=392823 RepID=A0ABN0ZUT9_9BACI
MSISLTHYSEQHLDALNQFYLPEEQAKFTSLPHAFETVDKGQYRIVILAGNDAVGFFLLHETERVNSFTDNPNAMLLTSLSINEKDQGKGYALKAMQLLAGFVSSEFPDCNEMVLAVNHKNIAAQKLYSNVGFQDTGRRIDGPIGEQWILNLPIAKG